MNVIVKILDHVRDRIDVLLVILEIETKEYVII
jgi:hypothetical protein